LHKSDRSLFARLLIISKTRHIDLEEILSYPLCTVSVPLASADGSITKTAKSVLMDAIERDHPGCTFESVSDAGAIIVDAMTYKLYLLMPSQIHSVNSLELF